MERKEPIQLNIEHRNIVRATKKALRSFKTSDSHATVVIGHSLIPLYNPGDRTYRKWDIEKPAQWVVYIHGRPSKQKDTQFVQVGIFHAMYKDIEKIMCAMCT